MSTRRFLHVSGMMLVLGMLLILFMPASAASNRQTPKPAASAQAVYRGVSTAVQFDVSPPLRDITPVPVPVGPMREMPERATGLEGALGPQDRDPVVQGSIGTNAIPGPIVSFNGPPNVFSVSPPDPVGDVGPNHYVAMSNLAFQIFDKTGTSLYGPVANNTLWAGFGGDCQTDNSGDPIVLYDQLADRWILTQFTASGPTYFNCVAVSTSGDPTGTYYRYAFSTGTNFPDYPKYGIWPDALYISTREFAGGVTFTGVGAYAVNRAQLLAGNPAPQVISFLVTPGATAYNIGDGLLPTDLDGAALPPTGTPNFFVGSMDDGGQYGAPQDALTIWRFVADFAVPANSSFTLAQTLPVAAFDSQFPCSPGSRDCIPQPGTATKVDILSYRQRPLHRLAYRNFGTHGALVTNQSVEAAPVMAGVRWYELRVDGANNVSVYQQGTYAPGVTDGIHRWMGSVAMDSDGNMALGYSVSNATTVFPGVRYTGRLAGDPLGTLPQGEGVIVNGTGSQTGSQRWGDYTSMNIDPVDDCTFWYVNEWVPVTSSVGWQLRIGSFRFDECQAGPDFTIAAEPANLNVCKPNNAVYTVNIGSLFGYTDPVTLSTAAGSFSVNPVVPPGSSTLTIGTGPFPPGPYVIDIDGTSTTGTKTATVNLELFDGVPGAATLMSPPNGATNVEPVPTLMWSAAANALSYDVGIFTSPTLNLGSLVAYELGVTGTSWTSDVALNPLTTYYWAVRAKNPCGNSAVSSVFSFTTRDIPPILLVDDDDNSPDVRATYTAAVTAAGLGYDVWDTANSDTEPDAAYLSQYNLVIWFTGDEFGGFAGPGAAGEAALGAYLDAGDGCLFVSSQDYYWDRGLTGFMTGYLGISAATSDVSQTSVTGAIPNPPFGGVHPLTYPFTNYSDRLTAGNGGADLYNGNQGLAAVYKLGPNYETTFWGFPMEALPVAEHGAHIAKIYLACQYYHAEGVDLFGR